MLVVEREELIDDGVAFVVAQRGPFLLALDRIGDGEIHVLLRRGRHSADQFAGVGVVVVEHSAVRSVRGLAADNHFPIHNLPFLSICHGNQLSILTSWF